MRCWIIGSKRWGDSEEVRWSVTWWGEPPVDEYGDRPPDQAPEHWREFKTEAAAMKYAEKAANLPENYWQCCTVRKMTLERIDGNAWDWEEAVGVDVSAQEKP